MEKDTLQHITDTVAQTEINQKQKQTIMRFSHISANAARELEKAYCERWELVVREVSKRCFCCKNLKGRYCFKRWMDVIDCNDKLAGCAYYAPKEGMDSEKHFSTPQDGGEISETMRIYNDVRRRLYIARIRDCNGVVRHTVRYIRDDAVRWLEEKRREYGITEQEPTKIKTH